MAQAFNNIIKKHIGNIMDEEGFVLYKTVDFIRLKEDGRLLQYIGFPSGKYGGSRNLEIGYLPLIMVHKREDIASEVSGEMNNKPPCGWSSIRWDFPKKDAEYAEKSMLSIKKVIQEYSLPYLNKYCTFTNTLKMFEENNPDIVPPNYRMLRVRKLRYKGYFALGAKDYIKAETYFKEYYSVFSPENKSNPTSKLIMAELEEILNIIHNPVDIEELMEKNRQNTIKILNLKKYIDVD
ncbi:hypothetical protein [uncultured Methanolobus sp.]|uniref:hypothetical protein n=1 Tax=uncultured Methanolobus sp. TaxID=218300 RepID=UPI002AAB8EB5|nr:hypothetical protein [uncultured Methanolobus sp.]